MWETHRVTAGATDESIRSHVGKHRVTAGATDGRNGSFLVDNDSRVPRGLRWRRSPTLRGSPAPPATHDTREMETKNASVACGQNGECENDENTDLIYI